MTQDPLTRILKTQGTEEMSIMIREDRIINRGRAIIIPTIPTKGMIAANIMAQIPLLHSSWNMIGIGMNAI